MSRCAEHDASTECNKYECGYGGGVKCDVRYKFPQSDVPSSHDPWLLLLVRGRFYDNTGGQWPGLARPRVTHQLQLGPSHHP